VDEDHITYLQETVDADSRLAARLKQILETPGISDKQRKQVERNLRRLLDAQELRKKQIEGLRGEHAHARPKTSS
jgi:tRNA C32,U32 (ribose-2'-O)-methylase TrmJ